MVEDISVIQQVSLDRSPFTLAASSEANSHESPSLLKLDPGVGVWAIVVFLCLLFILKKLAWGPIINSIDEREKNIRDSLEKARQAQNESREIANEQNQILSDAKLEATRIIQSAKKVAEEMAGKIKQEGQEEKNRTVESGIKEIEAAKLSAISDLRKQTGNLAIEIAGKLIGSSMDDDKHREYVDNLISEIEKPA